MAIYLKEFYQRQLPHGHDVLWSIRFDTASGLLTVEENRTSSSDYVHDKSQSPEDFSRAAPRKPAMLFQRELKAMVSGV